MCIWWYGTACKVKVSHLGSKKIRTIKTFIESKKCYCWSIYHKNHKKQWQMLRSLWKNLEKIDKSKVHIMSYSFFAIFFAVKLKLLIFFFFFLLLDVVTKHHIGVTLYEKQQILLCPNWRSCKFKRC